MPEIEQDALRGIYIEQNAAGGVNVTASNRNILIRFHDEKGFLSTIDDKLDNEGVILKFAPYFLQVCRRYPDNTVTIDLDSFIAEITFPQQRDMLPMQSSVRIVEAEFPDMKWIANAYAPSVHSSTPLLEAFNIGQLSQFFAPISWSYTHLARKKTHAGGLILRPTSSGGPAFIGPYHISLTGVSWFGLIMPLVSSPASPVMPDMPDVLLSQPPPELQVAMGDD